MQTSSPSTPKTVEPKSILLIGPHGGGKTTLAMQFPGLCIVNCYDHLDGPERYIRKRKADLDYKYIVATTKDGSPTGEQYEDHDIFDSIITNLKSLIPNPDIKTVSVDNLTVINEWVIRKLLKQQGKTTMDMRVWDSFKSQMADLLIITFRKLHFAGKTVIAICHERTVEKPDPKNIEIPIVVGYKPSVQGQTGDCLGSFFTDVWRCTSSVVPGGKVEFKIQTVRDAQSDLKNSSEMPTEIIVKEGELAFAKLQPFMKGLV